ncbi:hypothetical protein [Streptomyces sp. NPDC060194]|uniref:hypothetical protein n=1 Tax=Streptomyces sp. NPDC060194 TaxID=3347069 RepID=UPI00365CCD60
MSAVLRFADEGEAVDLTAFLGRLLRYDRAAAVRLQAAGDALAVFGRPPAFEVLAVRAVRLAEPTELDTTVSAGELLEAVEGDRVRVPAAVTGPAWAGVLPPRGGWRQVDAPSAEAVREEVAGAVADFRAQVEELPADKRTRAELDRIGRLVWSSLVAGTELPVRVAHAAQGLGFLRPGAAVELLASGTWLRLRTPYGAVVLRRGGGAGLSVSPV